MANYSYIPILPISTNLDWIMGDSRPNYSGTPGLFNRNLTWETINTLNIGFDAGFIRNKLLVNFDWFERRTLDMIGPAEDLPSYLGASPPKVNNSELKTEGFELIISWQDDITSDLDYSVKLSLGDNKSTVVEYPNPTGQINNWYNGKTVGEIWGYETEGFFESDAEVDQHADQSAFYSRWQAGDIKYKDLNGDGKIGWGSNTLDDPGDKKIIGYSLPRYEFGIMATINYKRFDFNMFWQGVGKRDHHFASSNNDQLFWSGVAGGKVGLVDHLDFWSPEGSDISDIGGGPDAYYPRPYYNKKEHYKNCQTQTKYLQDASYIRLKNIQLGYTIPSKVTNIFKEARIYVTGKNVLLFTDLMSAFDPEVLEGPRGAGKSYPLSKFWGAGINIVF